MMPRRVEVLGVPVDCVTMAEAVQAVDALIQGSRPQAIIAINPEKVIKCREDPALLQQARAAGLLIPDGIGVVLAARLFGLCRMRRVPGSELMPEMCARAAKAGYRVFLFGGSEAVNRRTVEVLQARYPGINIVGAQHGYVTEDEMPGLIGRINAAQTQILFVALGSPKQELWMERYLDQTSIKVCQGVGGTFDVICGNVRRAPAVFRRLHMEWLYRLITQPRRAARQVALPKFVVLVLRQAMGGRVTPPDNEGSSR